MPHPFKHPLSTHAAGTILGQRRNGSPIYAIAGGNGEGEGGSGGTPPPPGGEGGTPPPVVPPVVPPVTPPVVPADGDDGTDWKAMARKHEKRAKDNLAELEKLRAANMSEQEKAVAEAEKKGRTAAAADYGTKLASAEFRAACAAAQIDLGEAAEFIDVSRFVGDDGEVNVTAIKSAVTKFSKLAPKGAGRSGGDLGGGGSGDQAHSLDKQIAQAKADGNWRLAMQLENTKLAAAEAAQK
ncbi:hypothetical protein HRW18_05460 [Streptomyces lunaelactis]|uniref:hypothetical protein n=1 Tax=Streptomyces lunaelactis TaxID=1535768 RepID=UPI001584EA59|nr:hypothetical protein [Streptomyces lunaelactis]NUK07470.1 hypothetical protein [Streptomyces lunaelactis]